MIDVSTLVRPNISSLNPYSSARDEFSGTNAIFLDANENPFGTLNRYPDPYQSELKSVLAEQRSVNIQQIFIGNGSDEIIDLLFRIFCEPGKDKAIVFTPSYGMYEVSAAINNIELIQYSLNADFQISETSKNACISSDAKLLFICSPNNPTGNCISSETITELLENFNGIVVIDEAYIDFSEKTSWNQQLSQYPNLVVCQTMSKAYGLAAARIGIAYTSKEIILFLNKVKPPYNVSKLNQEAAISVLKGTKEIEQQLSIIKQERSRLREELLKLNFVLGIYPSEANFLLVRVMDANQLYADLITKNIVIRNRAKVIENCVRISIGSSEENTRLLQALKTIRK